MKDGSILYNVHAQSACADTPCWIHNPTDYHMKEWPMIRRGSGLLERQCEHGIGHPDIDSLWFFKHIEHIEGMGVHGCDGCCLPPTREMTP